MNLQGKHRSNRRRIGAVDLGVLALVCFLVIAPCICLGADTDVPYYEGVWRGIDPADGGVVTLTVTQNDRDLRISYSDEWDWLQHGPLVSPGPAGEGTGLVAESELEAWVEIKVGFLDGTEADLSARFAQILPGRLAMLGDATWNGEPTEWKLFLQTTGFCDDGSVATLDREWASFCSRETSLGSHDPEVQPPLLVLNISGPDDSQLALLVREALRDAEERGELRLQSYAWPDDSELICESLADRQGGDRPSLVIATEALMSEISVACQRPAAFVDLEAELTEMDSLFGSDRGFFGILLPGSGETGTGEDPFSGSLAPFGQGGSSVEGLGDPFAGLDDFLEGIPRLGHGGGGVGKDSDYSCVVYLVRDGTSFTEYNHGCGSVSWNDGDDRITVYTPGNWNKGASGTVTVSVVDKKTGKSTETTARTVEVTKKKDGTVKLKGKSSSAGRGETALVDTLRRLSELAAKAELDKLWQAISTGKPLPPGSAEEATALGFLEWLREIGRSSEANALAANQPLAAKEVAELGVRWIYWDMLRKAWFDRPPLWMYLWLQGLAPIDPVPVQATSQVHVFGAYSPEASFLELHFEH